MCKYTIVGGSGFIGKALYEHLKKNHETVWIPIRGEQDVYKKDLGIVFYCAGYGDCKNDPDNVLEANVNLLNDILKKSNFSKLYYFSSTRLYMNSTCSSEGSDLKICADDERRLFNLTKIVAEELCLKNNKRCYIVRPSNVYGIAIDSPLFLPAITKNAIIDGRVDMYVTPEYEKDYISVDDVVRVCYKLSQLNHDELKIINIASGKNTKARDIVDILEKETNCEVIWHNIKKDCEKFPVTSVDDLKSIIDIEPKNVLDDMKKMVKNFRLQLIN